MSLLFHVSLLFLLAFCRTATQCDTFGFRLKNILQPINDTLKKRGYTQPVVVIEKHKNGEDNDRYNNKPLKHIAK